MESYIALLEHLKITFSHFIPKVVVSDFEIAIRNAFIKIFPNVKLLGCYFHYAQVRCYSGWNIKFFLSNYIGMGRFPYYKGLYRQCAYEKKNPQKSYEEKPFSKTP